MSLVVDASVIIAVLAKEPIKPALISLTRGEELFALHSLPWKIGNAFSAMFKRKVIDLTQAITAIAEFSRIAITYADVELRRSVELSHSLNIYADDAYLLVCAEQLGCPLLTLDRGLLDAARRSGIEVVEVTT